MKKTIKRILPSFVIKAYETECRKETHINRALSRFGENAVYVEIGVREGNCIRQIRAGTKVAVDPAPIDPARIQDDGTVLFQTTSDEFFSGEASAWLDGRRVNVALVDGLHEFTQALRDVVNLERHMSEDGVIFVHDCNPPTRRHEQDMRGPCWNGDVWKVLYYLGKHRPDLNFFTLNCDWGLGVISGFSTQPPAPEDHALSEIKALDYSALETARADVLRLKTPFYSRYRFFTVSGSDRRQ